MLGTRKQIRKAKRQREQINKANRIRIEKAAPDLYNACKEFIFLEKTNMTKKQVQLRINIAKVAIAKVTGENNAKTD